MNFNKKYSDDVTKAVSVKSIYAVDANKYDIGNVKIDKITKEKYFRLKLFKTRIFLTM